MQNSWSTGALLGLLAGLVVARDVPSNVQSLFDAIKAKGSCTNQLATGFFSQEKDSKDFSYCGDHITDSGIIYLQGNGGSLVNMDIDCDGALGKGDGSCDSSTDTQSQTTFQDEIRSYKKGIKDLNAYVHPYVVLGNEGKKKGYVNFDPQQYGIEPLSIVAVKCGDQLIYGVWGDTNGDDGPPMVGEASLALGQACYGKEVNGNSAHDANDVLYIAFSGKDAVPGADGANWDAKSYAEFEASIQAQGDRLIQRIGGGGSSGGSQPGTNTVPTSTSKATSVVQSPPASTLIASPSRAPTSHATVSTSVSSVGSSSTSAAVATAPSTASSCPSNPPMPSCSWRGHCEGSKCKSDSGCSDDLVCKKGKCAI
ncbi:glycoside hydrolase family 75 [Pochonia chlamydosporia 170]|uniref:Endo-chitosanase n=1 Tax=Pochonia chlamydosporia 170 TaxID=1380566 RepID=A0A179FUD3_METCM|nr:glycoside hydrolase family 75 [Pochonia chlamydosporia 170]OAQ69232.1 glycoside hydrolase family 75 [Pochonia chlamydosporia 170]